MLLITASLAAPPDSRVEASEGPVPVAAPAFETLRQWNACTLYKREKTDATPSAMRAECSWPDVTPERLAEMVIDFDAYDRWIWPVDVSEVRRTEDERILVYQLQKIWALNDREVLLWASHTPIEGGGTRASWVTAGEEPLTPRKGTIRTPHNQGFWEVRPDGGNGSVVVHEIEIDAGGVPLPGWLLKAIQTRGFGRLLDEVHEHALTPVESAAQRK